MRECGHDRESSTSDLSRALLEADAIGHEQMAEMLEDSDDPLDMAEAHREAAAMLRRAIIDSTDQ